MKFKDLTQNYKDEIFSNKTLNLKDQVIKLNEKYNNLIIEIEAYNNDGIIDLDDSENSIKAVEFAEEKAEKELKKTRRVFSVSIRKFEIEQMKDLENLLKQKQTKDKTDFNSLLSENNKEIKDTEKLLSDLKEKSDKLFNQKHIDKAFIDNLQMDLISLKNFDIKDKNQIIEKKPFKKFLELRSESPYFRKNSIPVKGDISSKNCVSQDVDLSNGRTI